MTADVPPPSPPPKPVPEPAKPPGWFRRSTSWLWGYDFFISYQWKSGATYAVQLAQRLRDARYDVFLDRVEYAMGDDWRAAGALALHNTRCLILIATREAIMESEAVRTEVEIFTARKRQVVPIVFGEGLTGLDPAQYPVLDCLQASKLRLQESLECLQTQPSDEAFAELVEAMGIVRKRRLRGFIMLTALVLLTGFAVFASISWAKADLERAKATEAEEVAEAEKESAKSSAIRARAETRRAKAQKQASLARINVGGNPDLAILHAMKSVLTTRTADGTILAEAEEALRETLNAQGGRRLEGHADPTDAFEVSADSRWYAEGGADRKVRIWDLQDSTGNRLPALIIPQAGDVWNLYFDPRGSQLIVHDSIAIQAFDLGASTPLDSKIILLDHAADWSFASESRRWLVAGNSNGLELFDHAASGTKSHHHELLDPKNQRTTVDWTHPYEKIVFSRDEDRLAVHTNKTVHVWDLRNGVHPIEIRYPSSPDHAATRRMALSSDGRLLAATIENGSACLWDLSAPELPPVVLAHSVPPERGGQIDEVKAIQFSPRGSLLATSTSDGIARLWDLKYPSAPIPKLLLPAKEDDGHAHGSRSMVAFSADGQWLFVNGNALDFTYAWPTSDPSPGKTTRLPKSTWMSASNNGNWLLTSSEPGEYRAWQIPEDGQREFSSARLAGTGGIMASAKFSADTRTLLTNGEYKTRIWDLNSILPGKAAAASPFLVRSDEAASSSDHWRLAQAEPNGVVRVLDLKTPSTSPIVIKLGVSPGRITAMSFHPDKRRLLIAKDTSLTVWDPAGDISEPTHTLELPPDAAEESLIIQIAASSGGRFVAASRGKLSFLWDLGDGSSHPDRIDLPDEPGWVERLVLSPNGRTLAIQGETYEGGRGTSLRLLDTSSPRDSSELDLLGAKILSCNFSDDCRWMLAVTPTATWLWDLNAGPTGASGIELKGNPASAVLAEFSADGRWLLTGKSSERAPDEKDGESLKATWLWDLKNIGAPKPLSGYIDSRRHNDTAEIAKGRVSPDGHWLVTSGAFGKLLLWDLTTDQPVQAPLPGHEHYVYQVAFDPTSRRLATSDGVTLQAWKARRHPKKLLNSKHPVISAVWAPDGNTLACYCESKTNKNFIEYNRIWSFSPNGSHVDSVELPGGGSGHRDGSLISPDSRWYVQQTERSTMVWPLRIEDLLEIARNTAGRNFTKAELNKYYPGEREELVFPDLPAGE